MGRRILSLDLPEGFYIPREKVEKIVDGIVELAAWSTFFSAETLGHQSSLTLDLLGEAASTVTSHSEIVRAIQYSPNVVGAVVEAVTAAGPLFFIIIKKWIKN